MKKTIFCLVFALLLLQSCQYAFHEALWRKDPVDSRSTHIVKVEPKFTVPPTKKYYCILIADPHLGHTKYDAPLEKFLTWLDKYIAQKGGEQPLFCITLGDLVDHGTASEYQTFADFQKKIQDKGIPVYNILGNHDVYNSGYTLWKETCYPHTPSYYFETTAFQWYFLDTASGTLGRPQFYDLKEKLAQSNKPKLVFTHYPLYGNGAFYFTLCNPRERAELISLFGKNNVKLYCTGHYHKGGYYDFGAFKEHVLTAFGAYSHWYVFHVDETASAFSIEKAE